MQRTMNWWASLSTEQRDSVLAMPLSQLEPWVLDTMAAAGIMLVEAEMNGERVRLPATVTTDFIETHRSGSQTRSAGQESAADEPPMG